VSHSCPPFPDARINGGQDGGDGLTSIGVPLAGSIGFRWRAAVDARRRAGQPVRTGSRFRRSAMVGRLVARGAGRSHAPEEFCRLAVRLGARQADVVQHVVAQCHQRAALARAL
jgi:hypothetical protein